MHTPGPWKTSCLDTYCGNNWANNGGRIGSLTGGSDIAHIYSSEEAEENARLISAAPDMLQALEAIVARVKGEWDNPSLMKYGDLSSDCDEDIVGFAEEAIKKSRRI